MRFVGSHGFGIQPDEVWRLLNDPAFLAQVVPGCQRFEARGDNSFDVVSKIGFGPLSLKISGVVELDPIDPPSFYRMSATAKTLVGKAGGETTVRLSEIPGGTKFAYDANVDLGPGLEKFGGQVLTGTAEALTQQFFERLARKMGTDSISLPAHDSSA